MNSGAEYPASDDEVLRGLYGSLRAFAAVVGPREVAPDDLVHDAIVRTIGRGPLSSLDNPGAYLRRAILNAASNQRRRLGRKRRAVLRLVNETSLSAVDHYPTDLADLEALDPRARGVLYLREVEGYPYEAVAAHLGLSESNTRQIAARARAQLRLDLQEES